MSQETGTGKYEQLLVRCKSLEPVPTAVAHACEASVLAGAVEAAEKTDRTDFGWAQRKNS
jgi:hypothetical protein